MHTFSVALYLVLIYQLRNLIFIVMHFLPKIGLETACPIENFNRLSLHHRRRKRLVLLTIQCFQRFPAMLFLYGRPIRRQILCQIPDNVPSHLHGGGRPGEAGGELRKHTGGMVHKIGVKARGLDLLLRKVPGQLMNQGSHHFQVPQFFRSYIVLRNVPNQALYGQARCFRPICT